jgi:hypothetical protein
MTAVIVHTSDLKPLLIKNASNSVKKGNEIIGAKLVFCDSNDQNCQAIDKFSLSENNTFDCFQNGIEIKFNLDKLEISGYLPNGLVHILKATNDLTTIFKKLKRFLFSYVFLIKRLINKLLFF